MKLIAAALVVVPSFVAYAALVGWLKTLYFLRSFGLSPAIVNTGRTDVLFESWYVLQNLAYFMLIVWIAVQTRRRLFVVAAAVYAVIPIATHYSFLLYDRRLVRVLIDHQHTWLKLAPIVLLATAGIGVLRGRRIDWRWRFGAPGLVLMGLLAGSWGISAAKHFGSYDAERVLHRPSELLPRVGLTWRVSAPPDWVPGERCFLLHADTGVVVVLEFDDGSPWARHRPTVHTIRRADLRHLVVSPDSTIQPGDQYF